MPRSTQKVATSAAREGAMRFSMRNWVLLTAGALCAVLGFVTLAAGSVVAAPLLLVLGYVILIPLGIIL
jgi:hypothetical protein